MAPDLRVAGVFLAVNALFALGYLAVGGIAHARPVTETPEGDLILDVRRFHEIESTPATPAFPYSRGGERATLRSVKSQT